MRSRSSLLAAVLLSATTMSCGGETDATPPPVSATTTTTTTVAPPLARPAHPAPKGPIALDEYYKTLRVRGLSFSHDEKLVVTMSDKGGRPQLWVRPIGGGPATEITHVDGFVHSFAFSPSADVLAYEADRGGDELPHLFLTNAKGETPKDLVGDMPAGRRTQFVEWARDGKTLLYLSSARDEKQMDLVEYDLKTGKSTIVWKSEGAFAVNAVSADHRRILVNETKSDSNNDIYLVERSKPTERKLLTEHTGDILFDDSFAHDGRTALLTSDEKGEFRSLYKLDLASKKRTIEREEPWDVEWSSDSTDGRYRFTSVNVDGAPQLSIVDTKTGKPLTLPAPPKGLSWDALDFTRSGSMLLGFSKSDRYLGLVARGDTAPAVPYVIDLKTGTATAVSEVLPPALRDHEMVTATNAKIPAPDGKTVPALLYSPPGDGPSPPSSTSTAGRPDRASATS